MTVQRVLVIGAAGMLGRPVVRRLLNDGYTVRVMVRDLSKARMLLPDRCEYVPGDVRDDARLLDALDSCQAVHVNLSHPMVKRMPAWDVEVDGMRAIMAACRASGVQRITRISAMGVDQAADHWWCARSKRDADEALMSSDLQWTLFRPTWFMESLCTFKLAGPFIMALDLPQSPLRWIAGDDFARQIAASLQSDVAIHRTYHPQGPELLTIAQALHRLRNAWKAQRLHLIPARLWMLGPGALLIGKANYLVSLMSMTRDHFARVDRDAIATDLPVAKMTIEDYTQYIEQTGDWPRK